jgi:hypothetical protein
VRGPDAPSSIAASADPDEIGGGPLHGIGLLLETSSMETVYAQIERLRFASAKSFDEVLSGLYSGISKPSVDELKRLAHEQTYHDLA